MPPFQNYHHHHSDGPSRDPHPATVFFGRFDGADDEFSSGHHNRHHRQSPQREQWRRHSGCLPFPLRMLKKMVVMIVSISFFSVICRCAALLIALLFSPPVLVFCLAMAFASHVWDHPMASQSSFWSPDSDSCFSSRGPGCCGGGGGFRRRLCRMMMKEARNNNTNATDVGDTATPPCNLDDIPEDTKDSANPDTVAESSEDSTAASTTYKQNVTVHREETEESLLLALDLPGFSSADIKVSLVDNNTKLSVQGSRKNRLGDTYVLHRTFFLSKKIFDIDSISANYADGVLEIKVEKKPIPQPRVISITTETKKEE